MEFTKLLEAFKSIGEFSSSITGKILGLVPSDFLSSPLTAKLISIIIYLGMIWVVIHFATTLKKPVKYSIIGVFIILIFSILSTLIIGS